MSATSILDVVAFAPLIVVELTRRGIHALYGTVQEHAVISDVLEAGAKLRTEALPEPSSLDLPAFSWQSVEGLLPPGAYEGELPSSESILRELPLSPLPEFQQELSVDALLEDTPAGKGNILPLTPQKSSLSQQAQKKEHSPKALPPASTDLNELKLILCILREGREAFATLQPSEHIGNKEQRKDTSWERF